MSCRFLFMFLLLFICPIYVCAQQNPFLPHSETASTGDTLREKDKGIHIKRKIKKILFIKPLIRYQKKLSGFITELLKKIKKDFSVVHLIFLFVIAFFYGIIHALGPGHAKLIIGSYMLSRGQKIRHSFIAGTIFAATHVGMAMFFFLIFNLILRLNHAETNTISTTLYNISGVMIVIIGTILLVHLFIKEDSNSGILNKFVKNSSLPVISVISGLMPCPGALLVLIFSKIIGITAYGIISILFLTMGMALTVSIAGSVGVLANRAVLFSTHGNKLKTMVKIVRFFGYLAIISIGLLMILY